MTRASHLSRRIPRPWAPDRRLSLGLLALALLAIAALAPSGLQAQREDEPNWEMDQPPAPRDFTCFQEAGPYTPTIDIGADVAILYGAHGDLARRFAQWREQGYEAAFMTGISWGDYADYYGRDDDFKTSEVQTRKDGSLRMHHPGVGYNVPTDPYIAYIKTTIDPVIDQRPLFLCLEEPEYWADTGWSATFKQLYAEHYGEPWRAPDSSVDAQYRASRLKYERYFEALREVFGFARAKSNRLGFRMECVVPTHSLLNYAQWGIVSPMSRLMDLPEMDGYIAQVWTGTARTHNMYRGEGRERTFETAFLEYGAMLNMVRPTGRKVWFLADPIEDNPDYSWNDYRRNYKATIVASLMWPEVHRFEVMPWPSRIFQGRYPKVDLDTTGEREGIPGDYAAMILTVINALNDMEQAEAHYDVAARRIGVFASDSLMFQRAAPDPTDIHLSPFYGLAMPLLKRGVYVEPVQLENATHPDALEDFDVLFLTYEGQKPLKAEYHEALHAWVRQGGALVYVGDGADPYHNVREWWNEQGATGTRPDQALFQRLGVEGLASGAFRRVGDGAFWFLEENPTQLARSADGAGMIMALTETVLATMREPLRPRNHLAIERGPYLALAVLDESVTEDAYQRDGHWIDLFDPALPVMDQITVRPGEQGLFYNVGWTREKGPVPAVLAAAARIRNIERTDDSLRFTARGPIGTQGLARILGPGKPSAITVDGEAVADWTWGEADQTLALPLRNQAREVSVTVRFQSR